MLELLQRILACLINGVRVNRTMDCVLDGNPMIVKRRLLGGGIAIFFGNRFLTLARSGSCMFVRANEWIAWEIYCTRLLYPNRIAVKDSSGNAVRIAKFDGISLRELVLQDKITMNAVVAAARELRRVHQIPCDHFQAAWSHGDMHLDNVLYNSTTDRAVLIDFDMRHEFGIDQTWRHTDDLKILLLELLSRLGDEWATHATAFIEEYGEATVLLELNQAMVMPRRMAKVFWYTRIHGAPPDMMKRRILELREIVEHVARSCAKSPGDASEKYVP